MLDSCYFVAPVLSLNSLDDCVQETLTFDDPTLGSPDGNPTHYCAPSWFVFWKDLTIMEGLGRGVIGDFHRAIHKGKEVRSPQLPSFTEPLQ